ncbi:unnamed protein product [Porites lobata]|uniref:Uncharacterized protein n=1 Tax=Porites lobata TaxID=104759 RepID=A0ABN8Q2P8_9CNID|nr:unnamed protein product [Porites lobata]
MIIGTRKQLAKVNVDGLSVGESIIATVTSVRNLGSWFDQNLSLPMGKTKKTLGDRSFQIAAPALWNSLPASIRDIDNFLFFKRTIIKTYLFRKTFACYS